MNRELADARIERSEYIVRNFLRNTLTDLLRTHNLLEEATAKPASVFERIKSLNGPDYLSVDRTGEVIIPLGVLTKIHEDPTIFLDAKNDTDLETLITWCIKPLPVPGPFSDRW